MLSTSQIDSLRKIGLRPQVVACIVKDGKVLIAYARKHNSWMFPQGGIDNKEKPHKALYREMEEELGKKFSKNLYGKPELIYSDKIAFSGTAIGSRDLKTDAGVPVLMRGKYYLFLVINSKTYDIDRNDTEFDKIVWVGKDKIGIIPRLINEPNKRKQFIEATKKLEKYLE